MSDLPADYTDRLNIREQIARMDRNQAEIAKLFAEAGKLNRDRTLAPLTLAVTSVGAGAALFAAAQALLRLAGPH